MKVFSKPSKSKSNKSTPLLHKGIHNVSSMQPTLKPKGISKVISFKNKLTQSNQEQTVKVHNLLSSIPYAQPIRHPQTERNRNDRSANNRWSRQQPQTINSFYASPAPLINSIQYKSCKSDQNLPEDYSQDKIESSLSYINFLDKQNRSKPSNKSKINDTLNTSITNFMIKSHSQKQINYTIKKIYANESIMDKQNVIGNQGKSEKRKINYYKNSKIVGHCQKPVQKDGRKKLSLDCFKMGKKLGKGRFGSVNMVQEKSTGFIYALKLVDLKQVKEEEMESQIIEEMKLQLFMNHPNILKMYGYFRDGDQLCMILEYANEKCLFNKIHQNLQEKTVGYYTRQMIQALKYCHSESILHRDLKPENILLCEGVAKLADFGWAAYAPRYKRNTFCGTLDYVPPEILKGKFYDQKVDIWSLGVLIYEMSSGRAPFQTESINPVHIESKTMNRILDGDLIVPLTLSSELRKLILSILTTDPQKRLSLEEIERNPWLQECKDYQVEIGEKIWKFWAKMTKQ